MRWIIHIGIRKTGSKAIQRFLAEEAALGPAPRLCFPTQGRAGNWHEPLFFSLLAEDGSQLDAALAAHGSGNPDIAFFSYEGLHLLPSRSIRLIREKLGETQIVLFIRRQDLAINSLLNQYAKAHRVPFAQVKEFEQTLAQYLPQFDYKEILSRWAEEFGVEAITPVVYDKKADAVLLFCEAVGIAPPQTGKTLGNPNPALSRRAYEAFLSAKANVSDAAELPPLVTRLHQAYASEMIDTSILDGPNLLDEETCARIMQNYQASNEFVRTQWFPSRATLF